MSARRFVEVEVGEVGNLIPEPLPRILHPDEGQQRDGVLRRQSGRPQGIVSRWNEQLVSELSLADKLHTG